MHSGHAASCAQLTGVKRLACEKSVHKQQRQSAQSKVVFEDRNTSDAERYRVDSASTVSNLPQHQSNKKSSNSQKEKNRVPYNRKMGTQTGQESYLSKNPQQETARSQHNIAGSTTQDIRSAGLGSVQSEVVSSVYDEFEDVTLPPSYVGALDTALAYEGESGGIGDDTLYALY